MLTRAIEDQGDLGRLLCPVGGPGLHPESDILEHRYPVLFGELQLGGRARGEVAAVAGPEAAGRRVSVLSGVLVDPSHVQPSRQRASHPCAFSSPLTPRPQPGLLGDQPGIEGLVGPQVSQHELSQRGGGNELVGEWTDGQTKEWAGEDERRTRETPIAAQLGCPPRLTPHSTELPTLPAHRRNGGPGGGASPRL